MIPAAGTQLFQFHRQCIGLNVQGGIGLVQEGLRPLWQGFVEQFVPPLFGSIDAILMELLPASGSFGIGAKPLVFPTMND